MSCLAGTPLPPRIATGQYATRTPQPKGRQAMATTATPMTAVPEGARISICEVGPRDGFQIESAFIPTDSKIAIINALFAAGLRQMQVTSFVSPRAVPQLADAEAVLAGIDRPEGAVITALIPNLRGAERAAGAGVDAVHTVVSSSETHNLKNVNRSIAASLGDFEEVFALLDRAGVAIEGGIATAFGCPFEGIVPPEQVARIAKRYQELGAASVGLGDTTGMATPATVRAAVQAIRAEAPGLKIGLHFHNTRGVGLACVMTGLASPTPRVLWKCNPIFRPGASARIACTAARTVAGVAMPVVSPRPTEAAPSS